MRPLRVRFQFSKEHICMRKFIVVLVQSFDGSVQSFGWFLGMHRNPFEDDAFEIVWI